MSDKIKIELVSSKSCSPCENLKKTLQSKGIPFTTFNLEEPTPALENKLDELRAEGVRQIPAAWINGEFVGTGEEVILKSIKEAQETK